VCGAIGTEGRLEFATVGDAVNRAARLQGLTKAEQVPALVAADAWEAALSQGLQPRHAFEQRMCTIAGIGEPSAVVALM
jgi:class 3 adenylate cyclase